MLIIKRLFREQFENVLKIVIRSEADFDGFLKESNVFVFFSHYFSGIRVFDVVFLHFYLFYLNSTFNHFIYVRNYVISKTFNYTYNIKQDKENFPHSQRVTFNFPSIIISMGNILIVNLVF